MPKILFVCNSNRSRSPMAAAMFADFARQAGLETVQVESAGLRADARQMLPEAVSATLADMGLRPLQLGLRQVLPKMLKSADLIICFTATQLAELERSYPSARGKSRLLMSLVNSEAGVFDPGRGDLQKFRQCAEMMRPALIKLAESLA
ncbi:MAG: hypothetical protein PHG44_00975 [Lentisphaeria bacterium]|jgi:protein-tyrosine-phosphatase|nr:hypothetical protein [Lentisphaeria bacterium]